MKNRFFKSLAAALLTMAAVLAGQQAMATSTMPVSFKGRAYTHNSTLVSELAADSHWGNWQIAQTGDSRQFSDFRINWYPVYVFLNGTLRFKEAYSATDVVVNEGTFTVAFYNLSLWFYGASVETLNGTAVTNSSVAVSSDRHTITVSISGAGTEFGRINLDFVGTEPFSRNNTVIGGIETEYIYTGNPIEPVPTVTYNGTTLTAGSDYTVSYSNNIMPGTATVTVEGTGQYAGTVSRDYTIRCNLSDFISIGNNTYLIATATDLNRLACYVNLGNNCQGLTFIQTANIAFPHSDNWDNSSSTENNYIAIGHRATPFQGTFDGQNHTIRGIRIYKGGIDESNSCQGIFGRITDGGTVKRVNLADARITGRNEVGGIVGTTFKATIEDCTAGADVCIHTVRHPSYPSDSHGGIVGSNQGAVRRCISRATLTVKNGLDNCVNYGGIVGHHSISSNSIVTDCIAVGAVIPNVKGRGAIIGFNEGSTLTRNFYRDCKVASNVVTPSGVGLGIDWSTTDADGARPLYALTLPANTSVVRTASATLPGIGNASYTNGADIAGTAYYTGGATLTLTPDQGFTLEAVAVNGTAATNNGDGTWSFTMPAADATVTALMGVPYIDENGDEQTCTDFTLVSSSYAFGDDNGTAILGVDDNVERWYAVVGTVSLDKPLKVDGNARLILCDGAALNINADNAGAAFNIPASNGSDFTIYGQAQGTLNVTNTGGAIGVNHNVTVNGGTVVATGVATGIVAGIGIGQGGIEQGGIAYPNATLTINRGTVTATGFYGIALYQCTLTLNGGTLNAIGKATHNCGILAYGATVNILGGTLNATGSEGAYGIIALNATANILGGTFNATGTEGAYGIWAPGDGTTDNGTTVTLGWTTPDDRITASSIHLEDYATFKVRDGQTLYADDVPYSGDITASAGDLAGKTLAPYPGAGSGTSAVTARKASFAGVERYWTTFYSATRYALPAGAQAFIMKSDHVLYRIGDGSVIPANCAVVIMADASALTNPTATGGIVTLTETTAAEPSVSGNILLGVDTPTSAPSGAHVLSKVGDDFGFFTFTGTIPANKAYYVE